MSRCARLLALVSIASFNLIWIGAIGAFIYLASKPHVGQGQRTIYYVWTVFAIITLLVYDLLLWCNWKKVEIAIALVDATADFFAATKRLILVSVLYFFVSLVIFSLWIAGMAGIASLNDITANPNVF